MLYKITNGAVSFGADTILEEVNFEIHDNEKIAVVGRNGCGKSTLLNLITGSVELSEGTGEEKVNLCKSGSPVIGYLRQITFVDEKATMLEEILKVYAPILELEHKIKETLLALEKDHSEKNVNSYSDMLDRFDILGGYFYQKEYEVAIKKFGFSEDDKRKPLSDFSGGQRTKIAFIKLLLSKPDILLLDEPTNHLDITTIEWLEEYLRSYKKSIVIVSHDRMFLDKIVNVVYEIEYGVTMRYAGNYSAFFAQKQANYEKQSKDHDAQRKEIARLNDIVNRFKYKPTKASMALSKMKQIERMQIIDAPDRFDVKTFHANFQPTDDGVKNVLKVTNLAIGYDKVLSTVNFELLRGQKLGIIGANGVGKSTLVKTLVGNIKALNGTFEFGVRITIGYFDQQMMLYDSNKTVFEEFSDEFPSLTQTEVRRDLGAFLFCGEDVFKEVGVLSGGEKVRLALCKILKRRPNVLILDEPTNHMDIVGKETLEGILKEYTGTLIFISHDRYFVKLIADKLLCFDNDGSAVFYPFGYEKYIEELERLKSLEDNSDNKYLTEKPKPVKASFSTPLKEKDKLDKKIKKLEQLIADCDTEIAALTNALEKPEVYSDYKKINEIQGKIDDLNKKLDNYMSEWDEISTIT